MRHAWLVVAIVAIITMLLSSNMKATQTQQVSAGYSTVFYFMFLCFLVFIAPKIGEKK